ncbi:hypothetical protein ABGB18_21860 [Nonomuraea sp. B12E4]|uniref:hypothetical protein n=1 Tax=Nonomuraea sp. B12E4 TaxID=3153564 RepID=UPI00325CDC04
MNPGSEYQPPPTPDQVPGGRFEPPNMPQGAPPNMPQGAPRNAPPGAPWNVPQGAPPNMPPTMPQGVPPWPAQAPRRPAWLLPTLAAALVVLVAAGGVGAFLVYEKVSRDTPSGQRPESSRPAATAAKAPDVCAMLPKDEVDRLVPEATVGRSSRDDGDYTISFTCNWQNQRISYGEFWRSREIGVRIDQWKGEGVKTGRSMAQNSYEVDYRGGKYGATATPSMEPDEKRYVSPVKDLQGVGDSAFAQYTWSRDGNLLWYSYGQAFARVGDMTIEVKYQASQQRKDAAILSNDTTQSITEANAIREVSTLIGYFAKGVAAWQTANPNVLAKAEQSRPPSTPTVKATPSPTVLAAFPAECTAIGETATRLVPEATTRARGVEDGGDKQTECRWLNRELPGGPGKTKIRSALITVHRFSNRAGEPDAPAAKAYYVSGKGSAKNTENSSMGGITWGKLIDADGLGDEAYRQFVQTRNGEVSASSATVIISKGSLVIRVDYSGHQRPKDEPTNSPKVEFMTEKEAVAGVLNLARAYLAELDAQPVGS